MNELDSESQEFINWTKSKLENPEFFNWLINTILEETHIIYTKNNQDLLIRSILRKMRFGALEHGAPSKDVKRIRREYLMEMLDLIGWKMMELYINRG